MEVGKRLLEKNSLTKSFDNMDGKQCLKKAGEIFKEINLDNDLVELELIKTKVNETKL